MGIGEIGKKAVEGLVTGVSGAGIAVAAAGFQAVTKGKEASSAPEGGATSSEDGALQSLREGGAVALTSGVKGLFGSGFDPKNNPTIANILNGGTLDQDTREGVQPGNGQAFAYIVDPNNQTIGEGHLRVTLDIQAAIDEAGGEYGGGSLDEVRQRIEETLAREFPGYGLFGVSIDMGNTIHNQNDAVQLPE